jgi:hypothetical protein
MLTEKTRQELQRRIEAGLLGGDSTDFDMTNIARALGEVALSDPSHGWTREDWERYATAVERVSQTKLRTEQIGSHTCWTFEDGSPLSEQYLADARLIVHQSPQMVAEAERLRHLVHACKLVLATDEQDVMELVAAGLELLALNGCGDEPSAGLEDVCPTCRLRVVLRRMGERSSERKVDAGGDESAEKPPAG